MEVLNIFVILSLNQVFWKMVMLKLEYYFLIKSTTAESALFPQKTALSKVNDKGNRIRTAKLIHYKDYGFAIICLIF